MIPTGGYVKFREKDDDDVKEHGLHTAIDARPVQHQLLVTLAGCGVLVLVAFAILGPRAWAAFAATPGQALHLIEVDGFVPDGDARVSDLQKAAGGEVLRVVPVGGYARPLSRD